MHNAEPNDAGDSLKHRDTLLALSSVTDRQTVILFLKIRAKSILISVYLATVDLEGVGWVVAEATQWI